MGYFEDERAKIAGRSGFDQAMHNVGGFFGFTAPDKMYSAYQAPNEAFYSDLARGQAGNQGELTNMLMAQARGQGPSIAQMQLQQATDRNMQQAASLMASQRGSNPAAMRQIANQRAMIGQQMAGDSAMLRLQEQMQARAQLGSTIQNYVKMGMTWDEATRQAQIDTIKGEREATGNRLGFMKTLGEVGAGIATGGASFGLTGLPGMGGKSASDPSFGRDDTINPWM